MLCVFVLVGCSHASEVTIESLARDFEKVSSLKYDMEVHVLEYEDQETQGQHATLYIKDDTQVRLDSTGPQGSLRVISNSNTGESSMYFPEAHSYYTISQDPQTFEQTENVNEFFKVLEENFEITGNETLDGVDVVVLEGVFEGERQKLWIDATIPYPVKVQTIDSQGNIRDEIRILNISTEELDESIFEIPEEAQEIGIDALFGGQ
jgi:outer membrane lipoprotein-sorting protein